MVERSQTLFPIGQPHNINQVGIPRQDVRLAQVEAEGLSCGQS